MRSLPTAVTAAVVTAAVAAAWAAYHRLRQGFLDRLADALIEQRQLALRLTHQQQQVDHLVEALSEHRQLSARLERLEETSSQELPSLEVPAIGALSYECAPEAFTHRRGGHQHGNQHGAVSVQAVGAAPGEECLFTLLPQEALQRVLAALGAPGLVRCERVNHEWRLAVEALSFWPEWRHQAATLTESSISFPGTLTLAFGAAPASISDELRSAGSRAAAQAAAIRSDRLVLAEGGAAWTVLEMSGGEPTALMQHQARDFMVCACPVSGLVYSGDKEAMLRVWSGRTGGLLARVAFTGGAMNSLVRELHLAAFPSPFANHRPLTMPFSRAMWSDRTSSNPSRSPLRSLDCLSRQARIPRRRIPPDLAG